MKLTRNRSRLVRKKMGKEKRPLGFSKLLSKKKRSSMTKSVAFQQVVQMVEESTACILNAGDEPGDLCYGEMVFSEEDGDTIEFSWTDEDGNTVIVSSGENDTYEVNKNVLTITNILTKEKTTVIFLTAMKID